MLDVVSTADDVIDYQAAVNTVNITELDPVVSDDKPLAGGLHCSCVLFFFFLLSRRCRGTL